MTKPSKPEDKPKADALEPICPYCPGRHLPQRCTRVKRMEWNDGGRLTAVEFHN